MIHVGCVLREEIKCGNIKSRYLDQAWNSVEMSLLVSYICTFAESISQASFFSEPMNMDEFDPKKVINIEEFTDDYDSNYKAGNISSKTSSGCRFGFPKKLLKYTVPAVLQVNADEMEVQVYFEELTDVFLICSGKYQNSHQTGHHYTQSTIFILSQLPLAAPSTSSTFTLCPLI